MKNKTALHGFALLLVVMLSSFSQTASAYLIEPKSGGEFFEGKGTRLSEEYVATAGQPVYEYGRGLQWGEFHVKPNFGYQMDWDSNVFYAPHDPQEDVSHHFLTDTSLELPLDGGRHLLSGAYATNTQWFDRFDSQNHTDHALRGDLKLNFIPFTLDIEDVLQRTSDRSNTEFTDRITRYENTFDSLLEIPFVSFFLENEILDLNVDYRRPEEDLFDHNEFVVYQRVGYNLGPRTQILGEYSYTDIRYDSSASRDGHANQVMLGIRGALTEMISYQAWGGAQFRVYDEASRPDFHDFVFRGALQYKPSEISILRLSAERSPVESTFDDQSFYVRNRLQLVWTRQIAARIFFNAHGLVDRNEYSRVTSLNGEDKTRRDTIWEAGAGLEYKMPNDLVSFFLQYKFDSRDADFEDFNYDAHTVSLGVRASF